MDFFKGEKASLEKLRDARREVETAERELLLLRGAIFAQKKNLSNHEDTISVTEGELAGHVEDEANQVALQRDLENERSELLEQITVIEQSIKAAIEAANQHRNEQQRIEQQLNDLRETASRLISKHDEQSQQFTSKRGELAQISSAFQKASIRDRKKRHAGPSAGPIKPSSNDQAVNAIHVLGDIHGWAPGLINYLRVHQLSSISIGGQRADEDHMQLLFPNPMVCITEQRALPRVGLDAHPERSEDIHTPYHRVVVEEHQNSAAFISLGDLIDRGDHNELVLEIMRQSILQNMGMRWFLVGNHEQLVIENDFKRWAKNEFNYMAEGNKEHAGSFLHQPALTGCSDVDAGLELNFKNCRSLLGTLLLTQHLALLNSLDKKSLSAYRDMTSSVMEAFSRTEEEIISILSGSTWEILDLGNAFLNALHTASATKTVVIPGGIGLMLGNEHLFMHAEPNGLSGVSGDMIDDFTELKIRNGFSLSLARFERGRVTTPDYLWARDWTSKGTKLRDKIPTTTNEIQIIVHGHQAGPGIREEASTDKEPITVFAIDEGMTPYYYYNYGHFEQAYDATRLPEGYKAVVN
jgi:hypothetical protein